jgi:hypothetical protein
MDNQVDDHDSVVPDDDEEEGYLVLSFEDDDDLNSIEESLAKTKEGQNE